MYIQDGVESDDFLHRYGRGAVDNGNENIDGYRDHNNLQKSNFHTYHLIVHYIFSHG